LPPGKYTVSVEGAGFKTSVSKGVVVEAEQPRGLDITLAVGNIQDSVTVTASTGGLETENANVNTTIGTQEVLTLPQFGRDPYELLHMAPGVFGDNARQGNGILSLFLSRLGRANQTAQSSRPKIRYKLSP